MYIVVCILSLSFLCIWLNDNSCSVDSSHLQKELSQHFSLKKGDSWHTNGTETLGCWLSHPFIANRHPQVLADDVTCRLYWFALKHVNSVLSRPNIPKKVKTKTHCATELLSSNNNVSWKWIQFRICWCIGHNSKRLCKRVNRKPSKQIPLPALCSHPLRRVAPGELRWGDWSGIARGQQLGLH